MQNTATIDHQKLLFGNYATRLFCRLQQCTNDPTSILMEFGGEKRGDALFNIIRAGIESAYAEAEQEFTLTDFQISGFVDKANAREDKGDSVVNAFIGSVINKPAGEVPDWIKEVEKEAKAQAAKEQAEAPIGTAQPSESPNAVAAPSQPVKKSKAAPTVTG